jgi:sugar lactone lactonase YvrE
MNTTTTRYLRHLSALSLCPALLACGDDAASSARALRAGEITTWCGDGTQGHDGDGHPLSETWLNQPTALRFGPDGTALIVDWNNHAIRRVTNAGTVENVIGQPLPGDWPCQQPDEPASCEVALTEPLAASELHLNHPTDVAWDGHDGSFYLAAWHNHKIQHYDANSRQVSNVAGSQRPGFAGDDGPGRDALLNFPSSILVQHDGGLLIGDERNNRIRRIASDAERSIRTVVGAAAPDADDADGRAATQTLLKLTTSEEVSGADNPPPGGGIALSADGALYLADTFHHCIRRVEPGPDGLVGVGDPFEETVSTVAGVCGTSGYEGDGGPADQALLSRPFGVEVGPDDALYIADTFNHAVRRVDAAGEITTVAGTGAFGFSGDGGPAKAARLRGPHGITFDETGDMYVVDTLNNRIRRVVR